MTHTPTSDELSRLIASQRWSGARGERVVEARIDASVSLDRGCEHGDRLACCVVRARVGTRDVRYQLWLPADAAGGVSAASGDALRDDGARLVLMRALASGERHAGRGATLLGEPEADAVEELRDLGASRLGTVEQSNTSIVYDERVILKLYRRLAVGVQPEVEVTRFLRRRGFAHTPALVGTLTIEDDTGVGVAAMAQAFVPGARDAWAHAVEQARAAARGDDVDVVAATDARNLGLVTRALHDALASDPDDPAFAPETADAATVGRWATKARDAVTQGSALLRARLGEGALDDAAGGVAALARTVTDKGCDAAVATIARAAASAGHDAGAATRHHGDYHLGQVLRAPDGSLYVIDFEGEPARSLDERRMRHCPLRDVAGMLRSFAYAAATAALDRTGEAEAASRADAWEAVARDAFLGGYFGAGGASYLPRARGPADALVSMFELEKAFYELEYELRNRPSWVPIPLAGIARLAATATAT